MNLFWIICIGMLVVGFCSHILSWYLEKRYKNKMNNISNDYKIGK